MGIVYRGYDPVLAREIALKTVNVSPALSDSDRRRFLQRFFQEARIAAKLLHPGIVVTHDAATDDTTSVPFIAMELVTGGSLAERMERERRIPWEEACRLVVLLARALDYAHREGVVHRDMKPANVLVTADGKPKIADFGIAKLQDAHLTQTGDVIGTPYYMSPEQLEGKEVDGRSDSVLPRLAFLRSHGWPHSFPRSGSRDPSPGKILHKNPEPLSEIVSSVPRDLDGVVGRALAKERENRYASGAELAEDVERVMRGDPPIRALALGEKTLESGRADAPSPELHFESPRRSRLGALLFLLLVGGFGYAAFTHWEDAEVAIRENLEETKRLQELQSRAARKLEEAREEMVRGRLDEAMRKVEEGIPLAREGGDGRKEAEALLIRGLIRGELGEWSVARADLESSASVFKILGSADGKARALLELANLERDLGPFDRAEVFYRELAGTDAVLDMALLDLMRNDSSSAERRLQPIHGQSNPVEQKARASLYLGIVAASRGDRVEAERLWHEAREGLSSYEVDRFLGETATKRSSERRARLPGMSP